MVLDDEGTLVLSEGLGNPRLIYGRDVHAGLRIRSLNRNLADAVSASVGLVVAPEPPSAPAASDSSPLALRAPFWGGVSRPAYVCRVPGRHARTRRVYPLGGSSVTTPSLGGPPGPPLAPLPLFTWEGSAQLGTPRPGSPAVWSSLGRSLGQLPSILNSGVDHTLILALSRTLVRLRKEVAAIVSRPLGERDVEPLYQLGTAETLRRLLTEEYGTAVASTKTVVTGSSLRHLADSSVPPRGAAFPAAPQRPPSPPPPHYGAGAGSSSQALYGAETGLSANPPTCSGSHYYAPEEDRREDYDPGYGARPGGWCIGYPRVTKSSLRPPSAMCVARCRPPLRGVGAVFLTIDWSRAP